MTEEEWQNSRLPTKHCEWPKKFFLVRRILPQGKRSTIETGYIIANGEGVRKRGQLNSWCCWWGADPQL